ncbi:unnamed protein product [Didymodactylos carnosus]|uniref:Uncharacterized protein n=1 Tax=Didymodactylos carnosus TaxID=1234261 RepID=A0A813UZT8_9BILA|nr:unnamed protein product [Didymodactylos carnosus]CAF0830688.1 unnamed protein product [Didymodactylos carnosus]CAF3560569.1 unnamed protein product [Didymodactylos carnosus]CAF3617758.1 unnamed protein product [Didymodactylos carnosus]
MVNHSLQYKENLTESSPSAAPDSVETQDFSTHLDLSRITVPKKIAHLKAGYTLCSNGEILILQDGVTALQIRNRTLVPQHLQWNRGLIRDICWSSLRHVFIFLCQKRVYSFDPTNPESETNKFQDILPYEEKDSFWKCSCIQSSLYICYSGYATSVEEYDLSSSTPTLKKRWISPKSCLATEGIWAIQCHQDQIGLTIMDVTTKEWRIEVRNMKLKKLWDLKIPITTGDCELTLLPNNDWLVINSCGNRLFQISDRKMKVAVQYERELKNAVMFADKFFIVRTKNTIEIH